MARPNGKSGFSARKNRSSISRPREWAAGHDHSSSWLVTDILGLRIRFDAGINTFDTANVTFFTVDEGCGL